MHRPNIPTRLIDHVVTHKNYYLIPSIMLSYQVPMTQDVHVTGMLQILDLVHQIAISIIVHAIIC